MRSTPELDAQAGLTKLAGYPYQIASWVDDAGYPVSVAVEATIDPAGGVAMFPAPAGFTVPTGRPVSLTGSHIRPQPGYGYDERRHVTVWGPVSTGADGRTGVPRSADSASKYLRDWPSERSEYSKNGTSASSQPQARSAASVGRPSDEAMTVPQTVTWRRSS